MRSQAVLVAIGIDWEGRRNVLAVELANRESASSWKELLGGLRERGLRGVQLAISDDHAGLRRAIREVLPEAIWQRCYVHFLRNALDYLPRKANDDCLMELRWLYDRRNVEEARRDLAAWLAKWAKRSQAVRLGGGKHRRNAELLPPAARASQESEIDQHAGANHGGDQTADVGRAHFSERG